MSASLRAALSIALVASACASPDERALPQASYLGDARDRRAILEASLVSRTNDYARTRLAHYATGDAADWDRLPEWNPRTEPVALADLGAEPLRPLGDGARSLSLDEDAGEDAFFRYPAALAPQAAVAVRSAAAAARYGFWLDARYGAGGLVRVELADGSTSLAFTCATCHAARSQDALAIGLGNAELDLGRLAVDSARAIDDERANVLLAWGAGRVDVTTATGTEPVRIPDLRPVRFLTHLHHDATLAQTSLAALAVRLETLLITSHNESVRPPRIVALALAKTIWSLGAALPEPRIRTEDEARGAALFGETCAGCHAPPGFTGAPVALGTVGTDPRVGRSLDRGTGRYRVPSLRGVATRGSLLHDGAARGLDVMFDPRRTSPAFTGGARPGAIPGHVWGLDLGERDRSALVAYLRTL